MTGLNTLLRNEIIVGNALAELRKLPAASVDMVLTSPPYFRLRDYAVTGQLGLEPHVDHWVAALTEISTELRTVLKPTGTLWLNLGDTYATHPSQGAPRKSLLLGPERVAGRLVADGWTLRNKIVWAKTNPVPSSVRDRLTASHEYLYVFTQSNRYHFDLDAIRVPHTSQPKGKAARPLPVRQPEPWRGPNATGASGLDVLHSRGLIGHPLGKNPGDVWRIPSSRFRGAHHATFPVELARRAILAGCPPGGLVLDPFIGAGTTAVAAVELSRDWLGIELNPDFAALAERRIHEARNASNSSLERAA